MDLEVAQALLNILTKEAGLPRTQMSLGTYRVRKGMEASRAWEPPTAAGRAQSAKAAVGNAYQSSIKKTVTPEEVQAAVSQKTKAQMAQGEPKPGKSEEAVVTKTTDGASDKKEKASNALRQYLADKPYSSLGMVAGGGAVLGGTAGILASE